jgi:hypothetical protein
MKSNNNLSHTFLWTFLSLFIFNLFTVSIAEATSGLQLIVHCVKDNGNGTYTAYFGYRNDYRDDGLLSIQPAATGGFNKFSPGSEDRGQPSSFKYGEFPGQFEVTWDGAPLTWEVQYRIRGQVYNTSITADPSNNEQTECRIYPYADCIMRQAGRHDDGNWYNTYKVYFSYFNPGPNKNIAKGEDNRVSQYSYCYPGNCPMELDQNQIVDFETGLHRGVFSVNSSNQYNNTSNVYWMIDHEGNDDHTYASASWDYTRECEVFPEAECLQMGCQVEGQSGSKTAWFGYRNDEPFTVETFALSTDRGNYYNGLRESYGCDQNYYSGYDVFGRACIYPQPQVFEPGRHDKVFGVCFSGNWNGGEGSGEDEGLPIDQMGMNNRGYVDWNLGSGWYYYYDFHRARITSESKQCNRTPTCELADHTVPCSGVSTNVFLQSNQTLDPDNNNIEYEWTHNCKGTTMLGDDTDNPVIGLFESQNCQVFLTVTELDTADKFSSSCSADISVSACINATSACKELDMKSTEYLLADASNRQGALIERIAKALKIGGYNKDLSSVLKRARQLNRANAKTSWTYPDMIKTCPNSVGCSSVSLSETTNKYRKNSIKMNRIGRRLLKLLSDNQLENAANFHGRRFVSLRKNINRLMKGLPEQTQSC